MIELLVVTVIILILASLLLPALSAAKARGKDALCKSNQRQIGIGTISFADDHDGNLYGIHHPNWSGTGRIWFQQIGMDGYWPDTKTLTRQHIDNRYGVTTSTVYVLFECPGETQATSMPIATYYSGVPYTNYTHQYVGTSYDMIFDIGDTLESFWAYPATDPISYGFLRPGAPGATPENTPIVMDNQLYNYIAWMLPYFGRATTGDDSAAYAADITAMSHAFRHPGERANVLFLGGHVESRQPAFSTGRQLYRNVWLNRVPTNEHL